MTATVSSKGRISRGGAERIQGEAILLRLGALLHAVFESMRRIKGKCTIERRYYLSSLALDAPTFAKAVRGHWGVENPLHWTLDVTFREDQSRARTKNAAQNLATLRRIALNLIKRSPRKKVSQRQKRILAALDTRFLEQLLGI